MKLSEHFSLDEFTHSQAAARFDIDNTPPPRVVERMKLLCAKVLEPLRAIIKQPIIISSGFRCVELNSVLPGSSRQSQHMKGEAADIFVPEMKLEDLFQTIITADLPYDQVIQEGTWVHVSWKEIPRKQRLRAIFTDEGAVEYSAA